MSGEEVATRKAGTNCPRNGRVEVEENSHGAKEPN